MTYIASFLSIYFSSIKLKKKVSDVTVVLPPVLTSIHTTR